MSEVFRTVLSMSIGALVLGVMVLAARAVIGSRQTAALTLMLALLVARLVVPVNIESRASVLNLLPDRLPQTQTEAQMDYSGAEETGYVPAQVQQETDIVPLETDKTENVEPNLTITSADSQSALVTQNKTQPKSIDYWKLAAYLWTAGMAALALVIFISNAVFMRKVRRNRDYDLPGLEGLISQCAEEFGIKKKIRAVRMSEINNVAVCGIIRPKLLISPDTFEGLSAQQKKDVIMHEMSHIKRRDTLVSLVLTIVNIVHWFNPVVWAVFTLFRKDMEVMCDYKVLCRMEAWQRKSYADTLLTLAKNANSKRPKLAMALFMSRASIKRRITMVARYKKNKLVITALALILVVGIAVTGCTSKALDENINVTPAAVNEEGLTFINSYTLDYSRYLDEKARVYNIKKAAEKLNGMRIKSGEQKMFSEVLGPVNEGNGWKSAMGFTFQSVLWMSDSTDWQDIYLIDNDPQTEQMGGGIGVVKVGILQAAEDYLPIMSLGNWNPETADDGECGLLNWFDSDVVIEITDVNNSIICNLYGPEDYKEQWLDIIKAKNSSTLESVPAGIFMSYNYTQGWNTAEFNNLLIKLGRLKIEPDESISLRELAGYKEEGDAGNAASDITGEYNAYSYGRTPSAIASVIYYTALQMQLEVSGVTHHTSAPGQFAGMDVVFGQEGGDVVITNPYDITVAFETAAITGGLSCTSTIPQSGINVEDIAMVSIDLVGGNPPEPEYYLNEDTLPNGMSIPEGEAVTYIDGSGVTQAIVKLVKFNPDTGDKEIIDFETIDYEPYPAQIYVNGDSIPDAAE